MTCASPTTNGSIPYSIEQFLLEHVATHEQLQALVWLLEHPEQAVTAPELEAKIGISELELQEALGELVDSQLVARSKQREEEPRYRYAPGRSDLDAKTRLLAILYQQDRYEVVRVLGENAMQRMWNAAQIAFLAALSSESGLAMNWNSPPESAGNGGRGQREARGRPWKLSSPGEKPNSKRRPHWRGVER
jgi:DNA-binding HxlR family transcriptional regulator